MAILLKGTEATCHRDRRMSRAGEAIHRTTICQLTSILAQSKVPHPPLAERDLARYE